MGLFNWTPAESGLLFILLAFSIILDPYIGKTTDIKGPRIMSVVGFSSSAALWVAFCAVTNSTLIDKFILCGVIFALGFSIGLISTPNTVEISLSVDDMNLNTLGGFDTSKVMGLAYSFMNMSYGMGSIFGPFLGGILIQISGWRVLCINFAVLNGLSACLAFLFSGTPGSQRRREPVE
jgi:predicted MFS family arabinose efflux permease